MESNQMTFTNGSEITGINTNGQTARGQRAKDSLMVACRPQLGDHIDLYKIKDILVNHKKVKSGNYIYAIKDLAKLVVTDDPFDAKDSSLLGVIREVGIEKSKSKIKFFFRWLFRNPKYCIFEVIRSD